MLIPVQGLGGDSSFVIQEFKIKNVNVLKNNNNNNKNSLQIQHLILYVADSSDNDNRKTASADKCCVSDTAHRILPIAL